MKRYRYIGDPERLSLCEYHKNGQYPVCNNGTCPGMIDGDCRFYSDTPMQMYLHLFEEINTQGEDVNAKP